MNDITPSIEQIEARIDEVERNTKQYFQTSQDIHDIFRGVLDAIRSAYLD